jgi:hydroxyacyl-ACP dehydratase HTD2-like protein with hotdog domain
MWAGGSLRFPLKGGAWGQATQEAFRLDGRSALCLETMGERPTTKGYEHVDKIFVEHRRQYGLGRVNSMGRHLDYVDRNPIIDETRTLVFMRERGDVAEEMIRAGATNRFSAQAPVQDKQRDMTRLKALKDKYMVPTYSFKLTPDRRLLFQFSALSFNAHAIHIDPRYAQEVEGYKDLLVHGPLSLALMLMAVRTQAEVLNAKAGKGLRVSLMEFHYRNLAPLYVGEEMKVCVRVPEAGGDWDVWIEGPDGGFAVKGTATMGPLGKADRRILHKERKKLAKKTPSNDGSPNDPEGLVDKAIVLGVIGS